MIEDNQLIPIMASIDIPAGFVPEVVGVLTQALIAFSKDSEAVRGRNITIQMDGFTWAYFILPKLNKEEAKVEFLEKEMVQVTLHVYNYVMLMHRLGSHVVYTEVGLVEVGLIG